MVGNTLVDRRFFLFARSKGPPGFRLGSLGKVKMSRLYPSTSPLLWFFHFGKKKREKKKLWLCTILSAKAALSTTFWSHRCSRKNNRAFLPRSWMMTSRKRVVNVWGNIFNFWGYILSLAYYTMTLSKLHARAHLCSSAMLYKNSTGILSPFVVPTLGFPAFNHFRFTSFNFSSLVSRCKHSFNAFPSSRHFQTMDNVRPLTHS